jgi:hypothetical protein
MKPFTRKDLETLAAPLMAAGATFTIDMPADCEVKQIHCHDGQYVWMEYRNMGPIGIQWATRNGPAHVYDTAGA